MVQQRIYNFGDLLTQRGASRLVGGLLAPGVYGGLIPTVTGAQTVSLSAGSLLLGSGVFVLESGFSTTLPVLSIAQDLTLVADHADVQGVGGSPVTYGWVNGLLPRFGAPNPNSVALAYLRYPGTGPVTTQMLSSPPVMDTAEINQRAEQSAGWVGAPFQQATDVSTGPNIQPQAVAYPAAPQHTGVLLENTALSGLQRYQVRLPAPGFPVRTIEVYGTLPSGGSLGFLPTNQTTLSAPAVAGALAVLTCASTASFTQGDRLRLQGGGNTEAVVVQQVNSGTQITVVKLRGGFPTASTVVSLSVPMAQDGAPIGTSPVLVSGPLVGLTAPLASFRLAVSAQPLAVLGLAVTVPAQGFAFIKGIRYKGD